MPLVQAAYDDWSGRGVTIITINIGEDAQTVTDFVQKYRYTFPVLLDIGYEVAGKYNIELTPTSFFIDGDGIVQNRVVGPFPNKEAIEKLLKGIMPYLGQ